MKSIDVTSLVLGLFIFTSITIVYMISKNSKLNKIIRKMDDKNGDLIKKNSIIKVKYENIIENEKKVKQEFDKRERELHSDEERYERRVGRFQKRLEENEKFYEELSRSMRIQSEQLEKEYREFSKIKKEYDDQIYSKLEKITHMSKKEAYEEIRKKIREDLSEFELKEINLYKSNLMIQKKNIASEILIDAMENQAQVLTNEHVSYKINLPNDDLKGRFIGREGRNINTIETLLGVNLIIDDTPNVMSVSSFNSTRRTIAVDAINALIESGKINQAQIEEQANLSKLKIDEIIENKGIEVVNMFNITDMNFELVRLIGQLQFRGSMNQNVLLHSIEAANFAKKIANEINLDGDLAARATLLHDIGKIDSVETGKSHVEIGVQLATQYGECETVINAIAAHHDDVEVTNPYSVITKIADSISASRPGARIDQFDKYVERVEQLEKIACKFDEVENAYALSGGREIRIIVNSKNISDDNLTTLANKIKTEISDSITFPGVIKVSVIREVRHSEDAISNVK